MGGKAETGRIEVRRESLGWYVLAFCTIWSRRRDTSDGHDSDEWL